MAKKDGKPKSRRNKGIKNNPCGCYYCCGNPDQEHKRIKLRIPKHKPKNWIEPE